MKKIFIFALLASGIIIPVALHAFFGRMGFKSGPIEIIYPKKTIAENGLIDPLTLNPTAGFATHRFPSISSTYVLKARRVNAGDEVDVWDFQQNTSNYKLTSGGGWVDGSTETFYVVLWYDQSGNARNVEQTTAVSQPTLLLNDHNGYPAISYDGSNDFLGSVAGLTMANYINAAIAELISYNTLTGAVVTSSNVYDLPAILSASNAYTGISWGRVVVDGDIRIRPWNYNGTADAVAMVFTDNVWYAMAGHHASGSLIGYLDGVNQSNVASGDTDDITGALYIGRGQSEYVQSKQEIALIFNTALTSTNHSDISDYCKGH